MQSSLYCSRDVTRVKAKLQSKTVNTFENFLLGCSKLFKILVVIPIFNTCALDSYLILTILFEMRLL